MFLTTVRHVTKEELLTATVWQLEPLARNYYWNCSLKKLFYNPSLDMTIETSQTMMFEYLALKLADGLCQLHLRGFRELRVQTAAHLPLSFLLVLVLGSRGSCTVTSSICPSVQQLHRLFHSLLHSSVFSRCHPVCYCYQKDWKHRNVRFYLVNLGIQTIFFHFYLIQTFSEILKHKSCWWIKHLVSAVH